MHADRPDPDRLLAAMAREAQRPAGKLKIFLGAAAGVGKTVAMLEAAREARQAGRDVVIGVVETHGRTDTVARTVGLEVVPLRASERPGVPPELDLDGVFTRRPELVIVDELAHSNAPGGRHAKRWQDVAELLEQGIDVWTALNVQHLEGLNDVVARLTGVEVHETVPDHVFDRADDVEVIDLTPEDLVARLEAGKVYSPQMARRALAGFFQIGNLIALRQLALRRVAMRVGEQLDRHRDRVAAPEVWAAAERLLVAVGPSPLSARLVRVASRMARSLDVPWHAVSVGPVHGGPTRGGERVLAHLRLAEQLGAETASLSSDDVAGSLVGYARRVNATMLVLGAPVRRPIRDLARGTLLDEVIRRATDIEVHVVTSGPSAASSDPAPRAPIEAPHLLDLAIGAATAAGATLVGALAGPLLSESDVVMLYVGAITLAAFRVRRVAGLTAAALSALAFDFVFTEPRFTLYVEDSRYWLTFAMLGGVGVLVSTLASRLKEHAATLSRREAQSQELFQFTRRLSRCRTSGEVAEVAVAHLHRLVDGPTCVWAPGEEGLSGVASRGVVPEDELERVTARWAALHGVEAGLGTHTLAGASWRYVPLGAGRLIGFRPADPALLDHPEHRHLVETVVTLVQELLDRIALEGRADGDHSQDGSVSRHVRSMGSSSDAQ